MGIFCGVSGGSINHENATLEKGVHLLHSQPEREVGGPAMGWKPEPALQPHPSGSPLCVTSWIEVRSKGLDEIPVSWTSWTLVLCKTKLLWYSDPSLWLRVLVTPHKSLLCSSKIRLHAQLTCSYVWPSNSSGQNNLNRVMSEMFWS